MKMYYNDKRNKRFKRRVVFIVVLTIIGVTLLLIGTILVNEGVGKSVAVSSGTTDLFVVHSKTNFGDNISSFQNYTSLDNAYSYKFYVENDESKDLPYKIVLHRNDSSDISLINYLVLQDGEDVFKGVLSNQEDNVLISTKIQGNGLNNYEIKFWSTDFSSKLDFRINVETEEE